MTDKQEGGNHYESLNPQPIEVMSNWFSREEKIGFYRGNIIKYAARFGAKDPDGNPLSDAKKICQYATWLIRELEADDNEDYKITYIPYNHDCGFNP